MRRRWCLWAVLVVVVPLAPGTPGRADHRPVAPAQAAEQAIEAGPEDGFLCCSGWIPFLFHGEKVLTSTGRAGVFRSEARGEHWQRSMTGLVAPNGVSGLVGHVCQAASAPHVVYALAGAGQDLVPFAGLFSSEDFGRTWTRRGSVSTRFGSGTCAVDAVSERTVYVPSVHLGERQTWRSVDGGATFDVLPVPGCAAGAPVVPRRGVLYLDGGHGCRYFSTDDGATYSALGEPPSSGAAGGGGFAASPDGRTIFISTTDERSGASETFRSTDRGASYTAVTGLPGSVHQERLAFDPRSPARIYASTFPGRRLFVSTDGGLTFALLPASTDSRFVAGTHVIDVDDRGSLYVDSLGGPFRSDDGGATFTSLLNGFRASSVNNLAVDANGHLLVAVNSTRGVFRQTQGLNYRPIADTLPRVGGASIITAVAGSPSDADDVVVATHFGQGGMLRTTDGGATWQRVTGAPVLTPHATRMVFATGQRVYLVSPTAARFGAGLYRLDLGVEGGGSAAHLSSLRFGALAVDPSDPDVLFVGTYFHSAGLFKSTDGGQTLQDLGQRGSYSALVIDRDDRQVIYAGQQFGHVLRSRDGGRSFTPAAEGLTGAGVLGLAQDVRGTLFAWVRGGGLFASRDQGSSWHAVDTGEALARSGVEAGRATLVAHPTQPGLLYLGNAGVIRVQASAGAAAGRH